MIVITADQIDSTHTADLAGPLVSALNADPAFNTTLPVDRTAGDEIQAIPASGRDALKLILALTRTGRWSVGCGLGSVRTPLAASVRESSGDAFVAARHAVEEAKRRASRFALRTVPAESPAASSEAIIDLLLELRARRSSEGWELYDLTESGGTQAHAANLLAITPQAVSQRARAAALQAERAALVPLAALLERDADLLSPNEGPST